MVIPILFALLGAVVGSFVGVVSERIHTGQSFVEGRSRCNACARVLSPRDLVPILSYVAALGRCRFCGAHIPALYLVLEATLALLFAYAYSTFGFSVSLGCFLAALSILAFIVVYDLRHTVVPPYASAALAALSVLFSYMVAETPVMFGGALLTAGIIALFFFALHVFSGGRAMGLGDAPVSFSLALLVAPYAVSGLLFSFWTGALYGIAVLATRPKGPKMGIEVPFVPFLALGFLLAYFIRWDPLAFILL